MVRLTSFAHHAERALASRSTRFEGTLITDLLNILLRILKGHLLREFNTNAIWGKNAVDGMDVGLYNDAI